MEAQSAVRMNEDERVTKEIHDMITGLENENVKQDHSLRLTKWNEIFNRLLQYDGKCILHSHPSLRFTIKGRAHDALSYPQHPIIETAKQMRVFIEHVEYWGIALADIKEDQL